MNCTHVAMGIECGNNEVARKVLKRNTTNQRIVESVKILKKNNVKVMTQNLIGLPVEDPTSVDYDTLDFNIKLRPYFAWSSILYPYPGTEIGTLAKRIGYFDGDFEKTSISNKTGSNLKFTNKMEKRKIDNFHKLFSIIVQFPFLRPYTNFLISLPLQYVYTWIYFAFYGYKYLVQSSFKGILLTFGHYLKFYLKYVSRIEKKIKFKKILKEKKHTPAINTKGQITERL